MSKQDEFCNRESEDLAGRMGISVDELNSGLSAFTEVLSREKAAKDRLVDSLTGKFVSQVRNN
jgi:hypothetical protein